MEQKSFINDIQGKIFTKYLQFKIMVNIDTKFC